MSDYNSISNLNGDGDCTNEGDNILKLYPEQSTKNIGGVNVVMPMMGNLKMSEAAGSHHQSHLNQQVNNNSNNPVTIHQANTIMDDNSSQYTMDSSTLEDRSGILKLYPDQSTAVRVVSAPTARGKADVPSVLTSVKTRSSPHRNVRLITTTAVTPQEHPSAAPLHQAATVIISDNDNDNSSQYTMDSSTIGDRSNVMKLYPHQLTTIRTNPVPPSLKHQDNGHGMIHNDETSSQFTMDSPTFEDRAGVVGLYPHQSLAVTAEAMDGESNTALKIQHPCTSPYSYNESADESTSTSSLPHSHYPVVQEVTSQEERQYRQDFWNKTTPSQEFWEKPLSKMVVTGPLKSSLGSNASFEDIRTAAPLRGDSGGSGSSRTVTEEGKDIAVPASDTKDVIGDTKVAANQGYHRQSSENSLVSESSLGINSLLRGNSVTSNSLSEGTTTGKSTAQSVLDLSTKSLADALTVHDDVDGGSYYYEDEIRDRDDSHASLSNNHNLGIASTLSPGGYSADHSSFTLEPAHPIDECSESGSTVGAEPDSIAMMELKHALPMRGESEDDDSAVQHYGFGHARGMSLSSMREQGRVMIHRPIVKPFIPQTFPSLLDSSMSSSYSLVSTPMSTSPSFDNNCSDVPREGSKEEREDTLTHQMSVAPQDNSPVEYNSVEEPLAIEVPHPIPLAADGSRYVVDLEQIVEESSGHEYGELSASASGSSIVGGTTPKNANFKKAVGIEEPQSDGDHLAVVQESGSGKNAAAARPDQQIHRNPNTQFFNYRHQYYTEQYHYFDGDKYPSKGGDDDTDSTCSSVTLSQAFQRSVQDDDSFASSALMTESGSSHPTLSTVSSVTLSHALSVEKHEHADQGFYVAIRLGDYVEGQNDEEIEVQSVKGDEVSCADSEERDENHEAEKIKKDTTDGADNTCTDASEHSSPGAVEDVLSDAPAAATKEIAQSNERVEADILNMLIPECGVPIPSVMSKMGKQRSKGGMLLPWHSTRSIQNYRYGGGRRKKKNNMSSNNSLFSISSVHTFREGTVFKSDHYGDRNNCVTVVLSPRDKLIPPRGSDIYFKLGVCSP
eukprot:scaffold3165_cov62-Cyclotella_meneghiniana.AAC.6